MPREVVHWTVLSKAAGKLHEMEASNIAQVLLRYRGAAFLGAMSHDVPYYYHGGGHSFEEVASVLHGTYGNDTFEPLRVLARKVAESTEKDRREMLSSFLMGMLSHAVTDIIFHPMVFYFTGDYYDANTERRHLAQARHRLLETYLDSYMRAHVQLWNGGRYRLVFRELGSDVRIIASLLDEVFTPRRMGCENDLKIGRDEKPEKYWLTAFREVHFYQELFLSPVLGASVRIVNSLLKGKFKPIDALFFYRRKRPHALFDAQLCFRNPVTGDKYSSSASEMVDASVTRCVELFLGFDGLLRGAKDGADKVLQGLKGESLNFGINGVTSEDAKYYYEGPLPFVDW